MENSWKQEGRGISGLWETRIWPEGPVLPRPAQRGAGPGHPPSQRLESMGVQTPARAIGGPKGPPLTAAAGPQACGDGDAELSWASSLGIQSRGALPPSWAVSPPPPRSHSGCGGMVHFPALPGTWHVPGRLACPLPTQSPVWSREGHSSSPCTELGTYPRVSPTNSPKHEGCSMQTPPARTQASPVQAVPGPKHPQQPNPAAYSRLGVYGSLHLAPLSRKKPPPPCSPPS